MLRKRLAALLALIVLCAAAATFAEEDFEPEGDLAGDYDDLLATLDTVTSGDWLYLQQDDGTLAVVQYQGTETTLTVPDTPDGLPVTAIFSYCFPSGTLEQITIPSSIRTLYPDAFLYSSPTRIVLNEGLEAIGDTAFFSCEHLTMLEIPASVVTLGEGAFQNCDGLTEVILPSGLTSLGRYTFLGCSALAELYVPASVLSIGEDAFPDEGNFTLLVEANSYAETYAKQHGVQYQVVLPSKYQQSRFGFHG